MKQTNKQWCVCVCGVCACARARFVWRYNSGCCVVRRYRGYKFEFICHLIQNDKNKLGFVSVGKVHSWYHRHVWNTRQQAGNRSPRERDISWDWKCFWRVFLGNSRLFSSLIMSNCLQLTSKFSAWSKVMFECPWISRHTRHTQICAHVKGPIYISICCKRVGLTAGGIVTQNILHAYSRLVSH